MTKSPTPAAARFPEFRAWAREITQKARDGKKRGYSSDINGALARAMERAYQAGYADAISGQDSVSQSLNCDPSDPTAVPSYRLSARCRDALYTVGLCNNGSSRNFIPDLGPRAVLVLDPGFRLDRVEACWILEGDRVFGQYSIADRTIQTMVSLGLLAPASTPGVAGFSHGQLALSPKGLATYRALAID